MKKWPKVSLVVCTHNRCDSLKKYLFKSILDVDYPNFEIVIVDDASSDATRNLIKNYQSKIKNLIYVRNNRQRGLCYLRNLGVKMSKGDIIAFTDDDCYLDKGWLRELVSPFIKNSRLMIVGGKILFADTTRIISDPQEPYGCNMAFRRKIFRKFYFDNNLYFNKSSWHDEIELINRIRAKGFELFYSPSAKLRHYVLPAKYRAYKELGAELNRSYMKTKKENLAKYYFTYIFLIFLYFKARLTHRNVGKRKNLIEHEIIYPSYALGNIFRLWKFREINTLKAIYCAYLLVFEIPFKAKLKNLCEEIVFKFNLGMR
jgi:glycosyltransferase involved in cell wall biosynthesis